MDTKSHHNHARFNPKDPFNSRLPKQKPERMTVNVPKVLKRPNAHCTGLNPTNKMSVPLPNLPVAEEGTQDSDSPLQADQNQ